MNNNVFLVPHKVLSTLSLLIFIFSGANGQNLFKAGLIRTVEGKINLGYIQKTHRDERFLVCKFKKDLNASIEEFSPSQISGYEFPSEEKFVSVSITENGVEKHLFFENIVEGKVRLLSALNRFLIITDDGVKIELTKTELKEQLELTLGECPYIKHQIKVAKLKRDFLKQIVSEYNSCSKNAPNSYAGDFSNEKIKFTFLIGIESTSVSPKSNAFFETTTSNNLAKLGVEVRVPFSKRFALRLGVMYKDQKLLSKTNAWGYTNSLKLDLTEFDIPVLAEVKVLRMHLFDFYVVGGVTIPKIRNYYSEYLDPSFSSYPKQGVITSIDKSTLANFGIGSRFKISPKSKITMELHKEVGRFQTEGSYLLKDSNLKQFTLYVGYLF